MLFYDCIGAILSLLATYYFIRLNRKAWFLSLAASAINSWLYLQNGIFADMSLEMFYFFSTCYGLYRWSRPNTKKEPLLSFSKKHWIGLSLGGISIYVIIFYILASFTPSKIPQLDAFTTALSLMAQLLMCYKIIATWIFWFITDALYLIIYWRKQLPFHTILMFIYMVMAVIGYVHWSKSEPSYAR
jgi:nicotinamide mononucleotide transporter